MSISFYIHRTRLPSAGHDSKSFAVKNRKIKRNIGEILHRVSKCPENVSSKWTVVFQ